jgi:hypothetical protein
MYAVEQMIEALEEQQRLAPRMIENPVAGGSVEALLTRCTEQMNMAHEVKSLKAVEAGPRRYVACVRKAKEHILRLRPLFERCGGVLGAAYTDGAVREKALAQLKDVPPQIVAICKAAAGELDGALKVLEEGEGRLTKVAAAGAK